MIDFRPMRERYGPLVDRFAIKIAPPRALNETNGVKVVFEMT